MENEIKNNKQYKLSELIILITITTIIGFILGLSTFKALYEDKEEKTKVEDAALEKFIDNYNYIVQNYYGPRPR